MSDQSNGGKTLAYLAAGFFLGYIAKSVYNAMQSNSKKDVQRDNDLMTKPKRVARGISMTDTLPSTFYQSLDMHFPGSVTLEEFTGQLQKQLKEKCGFVKDNSLALCCLCRDELCQPLYSRMGILYGKQFNCAGLAGFLFLGITGIMAGLAHAPKDQDDGKHRVIYMSMPHIGITLSGECGKVSRPGVADGSSACGALSALRNEMLGRRVSLKPDRLDSEMLQLKQRVLEHIEYGVVPSQVTLTRICADIVHADLVELTQIVHSDNDTYYAVVTGIVIHGPVINNNEARFIWPHETYVLSPKGKRIDLEFVHNADNRFDMLVAKN